jgi:hypothetical protein
VRAAFTVPEMEGLARSVFGDVARVRAEPIFRLSMVVDRTSARIPGGAR